MEKPEHQYRLDEPPSEAMRERYEREVEQVHTHYNRLRKEISRRLIKKNRILCIQMVKKGTPLDQLHPERITYLRQVQHPNLPLSPFHNDSFRYHLGFTKDDAFDVWDASHGETKPPYPIEEYAAIVGTGSEAMMFETEAEDKDWIERVWQFLDIWKTLKRPGLLVCFGHQLYTASEGGEIGWIKDRDPDLTREFGPSLLKINDELRQTDPLLSEFDGNSLSVVASHMQEVQRPPQSAKVLAWNATSPNQLLRHAGDLIWTIQNHPELTSIHLDLATIFRSEALRREGYTDEDLESLKQQVIQQDTNQAREVLFVNFLRQVEQSIIARKR